MVWNSELVEFIYKGYELGLCLDLKESPFLRGDEKVRKANLSYNYTEDEIKELKSIRDIQYFVEKYPYKIYSGNTVEATILYDFQKDLLDSIIKSKFNAILCARQMGLSMILAIVIMHYILLNCDKTILMYSQNCNLMEKIKTLYKSMPFFMKPGVEAWNAASIKFDNGCKLIMKSSVNSGFGIGFGVDMLVMEDIGFIKEESLVKLYRSLFPVLNARKNSQTILASSSFKEKNKFIEIVKSEDTFWNIKILPWYVHPRLDDNWKNEKIKMLGLEQFKKEYELDLSTINDKTENKDSVLKKMIAKDVKAIYQLIKNQFQERNIPLTEENIKRYVKLNMELNEG